MKKLQHNQRAYGDRKAATGSTRDHMEAVLDALADGFVSLQGTMKEMAKSVETLRGTIDRSLQSKEDNVPRPSVAAAADNGFRPGVTVAEAERRLILETLAFANNNKTRAAELLGVSLKTLHNKLKEYEKRG